MKGQPYRKHVLLTAAGFLLLPLLHPFILPWVGVASHLLWFVHAPAVGLLTFQFGRSGGLGGLVVSGALVAAGEAIMGAGYFQGADMQTVIALTTSVLLTGVLVAGFALFARNFGARYHSLFDAADIALIRLDARDQVVEMNQAALGLFGLDALTPGLRLGSVVLRPPAAELLTHSANGPWTGSIDVANAAGVRPIRGEVQVLSDPASGGRQILIRDRSMEINQAEELERQAKLATLGEAMAGVAHELNNPLSVIIGHAALELDADEAPTTETLEIVLDQAERMKDLIGELLGFSRTRNPDAETDLGAIVKKVARVQEVATGADVRILTALEWQGTASIRADEFEQVLLNLVGNAVYAARRGSDQGVVLVRLKDPVDGWIRIEVEDNGAGIAAEVISTLFHPFVTTKPEGEGTGLGLAICRRLARSWGGELTATNRSTGGACFRLSIPTREVLPETDHPAATPPEIDRGAA